jgi:transposase, IS5 family
MLSKNDKINQFDLFRNELENLLDLEHPLCKMAKLINWQKFEDEFSKYYCVDNGRPSKTIHLMVSLEYLKQKEGLSDEEKVVKWQENPYWQYFGGEKYFQKRNPI